MTFFTSWIAAVLLILTSAAHAQTTPLYQSLGEKPGIAALASDFVDRMKAHPRIGKMFDNIKSSYLKESFTDQFCELSGGPCKYDGETMKNSHAELAIDKAQFNLVVEILQDAMDARGISFTAQNRLLAKLAPMHREIITVE